MRVRMYINTYVSVYVFYIDVCTYVYMYMRYACMCVYVLRVSYLCLCLSLWSSVQSSWLQIRRSRGRFPALPDFLRSSESGTGSTQPREYN
jgi:hypothetical protein